MSLLCFGVVLVLNDLWRSSLAACGARGPAFVWGRMASIFTKFPVAEKNLLKIFASNKHISLQVVNNRTGHIFLWANTLEKEMKERLKVTGDKAWDMGAARLCAGLLARRARDAGHQQFTYERGKQRYQGKVKVVIDTLTEHGVEFIQYAGKRPPRFPWDKAG